MQLFLEKRSTGGFLFSDFKLYVDVFCIHSIPRSFQFLVACVEESKMKIHHMRNATMLLTLGEHQILVDPMLSDPGTLAGFKMFGGGRRANPLVPLPANAEASIEQATLVLITHEHPDHIDPAAVEWIKARNLPVYASSIDAPNLKASKGLDARDLHDGMLV